MTNTRNIIIKLKEVREAKQYSFNDIIDMLKVNGDYISKSTLSRIFSDGSEDLSFKYEETIRPIAKALLNIEHIDSDDNPDVQAMKTLLQYKIERIEELEHHISVLKTQLDKEQIKHHEKLEKERELHQRSIEFLKNQIDLKDKRMDQKDQRFDKLFNHFLNRCDNCKNNCCDGI